jgi:pyruvate formate lyase activating enzyme
MTSLTRKTDHKLECQLCPHFCKLSEGKTGICGARKNTGKEIELTTYGMISGHSLDPVEKKPLYHFYPGSEILSIGSYGCNMKCDFCQNFNISQNVPQSQILKSTPEKIINEAVSTAGNIGLAFTYNEPSISFEFMIDTAILAREKGLSTVMVSNGYVNSDPLSEIIRQIDAFNIDLKAFNNDFYRRLTGAEIEPVKNTLKQIAKSGRHLEITTLIIPGKNDDEHEMALQVEWIAGELGKEIPLHLSRYFPRFRRHEPSTSDDILIRMAEIASSRLENVYLGNTGSDLYQDTICPGCKTTVTRRSHYNIIISDLDENGNCTRCNTKVYRYFKPSFLSGN